MRLSCTLVLPDDADISGAEARVQVEDTTRADAPARVVAAVSAPAVDLPRRGRRLGPMEVDVAALAPGRRYTARGLVTRGAALQSGDLVTTQAIPVAEVTSVDLPLTRVP